MKLQDISDQLPDIKVRELKDSVVRALEKNIHYASVLTKDGVNRVETEGHTPNDIKDDEWIKVIDENGELDIEATATKVVKELLIMGAILIMRYDDEMYDEVTDDDKQWIDDILKGA